MKLEARDLAYGYRGHVVGQGANLTLSAGEIVCILGPNGGGKTTLFRTLLGLIAPLGGEVLLEGSSLHRRPRSAIARMLGYVPQAHTGYFPFTVQDVVLMGRTAHLSPFATPLRSDREQAMAAIERVGLATLADSEYTRISGGERQLALIARALAQATPLLVMDEPTASLDFGNQVRVLETVVGLAKEGKGILLSTHDPDQVFLCADRVALVHRGRVTDIGPPQSGLDAGLLRDLYGVEVQVSELDIGGKTRRVCVPVAAQSAISDRE
ncbi:MAG TPA: ABC transporter ATP-binding protein [Burkholderiales bacterium]|nr:ABC transporter ATP-binding protein [Burkholderiales bacterium]